MTSSTYIAFGWTNPDDEFCLHNPATEQSIKFKHLGAWEWMKVQKFIKFKICLAGEFRGADRLSETSLQFYRVQIFECLSPQAQNFWKFLLSGLRRYYGDNGVRYANKLQNAINGKYGKHSVDLYNKEMDKIYDMIISLGNTAPLMNGFCVVYHFALYQHLYEIFDESPHIFRIPPKTGAKILEQYQSNFCYLCVQNDHGVILPHFPLRNLQVNNDIIPSELLDAMRAAIELNEKSPFDMSALSEDHKMLLRSAKLLNNVGQTPMLTPTINLAAKVCAMFENLEFKAVHPVLSFFEIQQWFAGLESKVLLITPLKCATWYDYETMFKKVRTLTDIQKNPQKLYDETHVVFANLSGFDLEDMLHGLEYVSRFGNPWRTMCHFVYTPIVPDKAAGSNFLKTFNKTFLDIDNRFQRSNIYNESPRLMVGNVALFTQKEPEKGDICLTYDSVVHVLKKQNKNKSWDTACGKTIFGPRVLEQISPLAMRQMCLPKIKGISEHMTMTEDIYRCIATCVEEYDIDLSHEQERINVSAITTMRHLFAMA